MASAYKFSFVVSNYNYERYLGECLDSLVHQDYDPSMFEIICVDDGSTDHSWSMIKSYQGKYPNFVAVSISNSGLEKAVNTGIRRSQHDYVIRVDADDFVATNLLTVMNEAMNSQAGFDFYYCRDYVEYYSADEQYPKTLPVFDRAEIFSRGDFFATATVYKKSDLQEIGWFPEDVKNCGLENYAVILQLLNKDKKGLAVMGASFTYRRHRANMSIVKRQAIIDYGRRLLNQYGRTYQTNQYHPYGLRLETQTP